MARSEAAGTFGSAIFRAPSPYPTVLVSSPLNDPRSSLLLRSCRLGLRGLLFVAVDHHNADKRSHDGGAQESQEDGDADGPDTGREEVMQRVARIDERLEMESVDVVGNPSAKAYHEQRPGGVVKKDGGCGQKHGGSYKLAQLSTVSPDARRKQVKDAREE